MKTLKVWDKEFKLDIGDELKVKDLRKIQPHFSNMKEGQEIDMVINIVKDLSQEEWIEDKIDNLNMDEFTSLSEQITTIIEPKKKTSE